MSQSPHTADSSDRDEPVGMTVHALPPLALDEAGRTRSGRWKLLLVLLACACPVILSYFTYFVIRPEGRTNYAHLVTPGKPWPDIKLSDLQGQAVDAGRMRGQWILLVLGPSACDADCEGRLFMQRQLREMTGRERERIEKVWLVLDQGEIRPQLLQALQATPAMSILRADPGQLAGWLQPAEGARLEDHLYLVDPMGLWMMRAPPQADPAKFKKDLERLLRASKSWDRPGRE